MTITHFSLTVRYTSRDDFKTIAVVDREARLFAAKVARWIGIRVVQIAQVLDACQLRAGFQLIFQHYHQINQQTNKKREKRSTINAVVGSVCVCVCAENIAIVPYILS